jgi:hypothetical protein
MNTPKVPKLSAYLRNAERYLLIVVFLNNLFTAVAIIICTASFRAAANLE